MFQTDGEKKNGGDDGCRKEEEEWGGVVVVEAADEGEVVLPHVRVLVGEVGRQTARRNEIDRAAGEAQTAEKQQQTGGVEQDNGIGVGRHERGK